MNFSRFLDIQSWWEVPSIAYFCSLFRTAFNLLDFDIEELEEALLTDGTEESACSLLTELIVRLLNGCLGNNDVSAFNYQMYLRRLFRRKCQETGRYNPFNTDIDFQFLPLRTKVEILYALCDFRLDADDVFELFKNLEAESLRVEPLGWDDNDSAYWYFYGTRLYREDIIKKPKGRSKKKKLKESKKRGWFYGDDWLDDDETKRVWQVVCFTEEDWTHLTEKFSKATSKVEKELYRSLSQNFLPEIPRLFQEKERLQRKRLLELPRRTSSRVLQKIKQKEEDKQSLTNAKDDEERKHMPGLARENRAKRRNLLRSKSLSSDSSDSLGSEKILQKMTQRSKSQDKRLKKSPASQKGEPPPGPPIKTGRKTNNSLASATGQILIPDNDDLPASSNCTRKKLKTSQIFSQTEEDIQTDMYKVLEQLTTHEDAWPFMEPVEEKYAPNYYTVIRRPMDLNKMEERLDTGFYTDFSMFKADFKLIVNNCRLYNGQDNEYTEMVDNLQAAFDRLTEKYIHRPSSSDEEIAVEYQLPTPSRKHKLPKSELSESPTRHKTKKQKFHSETGEPKSTSSDAVQEEQPVKRREEQSVKRREEQPVKKQADSELKKSKESYKNKQGKGKKKHRGHHRHSKHSHKKNSHKPGHNRHGKKQKHSKDKESKKSKQKKKKNKHSKTEQEPEPESVLKRRESQESLESSNRSRSASPLPSIHTPTPSPEPADREREPSEPTDNLPDEDFSKNKYDQIKERRRHMVKDAWESLFDYNQKGVDKQKQNLNLPEKVKNQKLKETIEKLKAKNEKYKDTSLFNSLFAPSTSDTCRKRKSSVTHESSSKNLDHEDTSDDNSVDQKVLKTIPKKGHKKITARNESASEALEQAVKDISKWLDDAPKSSALSSPCDSPAQTISTEEHDNSRLDDEFSQGERSIFTRKELSRKRPSSREPKIIKRREIQRTIERLQPGKSKGNLLTNVGSKYLERIEDVTPLGPLNKTRDTNKTDESSPKLSLGSVLPTVEFTLGNDHKFGKDNDKKYEDQKEITKTSEEDIEKNSPDTKQTDLVTQPDKKDVEVETDPQTTTKPSQEKATPNLSAWFKAFGTPKSVTTINVVKKKVEETEVDDKGPEIVNIDNKSTSPKNVVKYDSPNDAGTPNPDGGDSPLPNTTASSRQRRTSTGSSVSERSSFSQDLDSPRHQISHTSPLLRSPASPRIDEFQKITYPIINGTVRAGFYQDTTSIKSSPEKSCSPREAPQSPYSHYTHVYVNNSNIMGPSTPGYYFVDHNKSPLPTYGQNQLPYYDSTKAAQINKPRLHEDYTSLSPDTYPQSTYPPLSPAHSPCSYPQPPNYSQTQQSPQAAVPVSGPSDTTASHVTTYTKPTLIPIKRRLIDTPVIAPGYKKSLDGKELAGVSTNKNNYPKIAQCIHSLTTIACPSVDDIALALSEKSEIAKLNSLREKSVQYNDKQAENKDIIYGNENIHDKKKDNGSVQHSKPVNVTKKDNIDMMNMGYMNPENDKRNSGESHEPDYSNVPKSNINSQQKGYEADPVAIDLGFNNQQLHKSIAKSTSNPSNIPPAHSHDRSHNDINLNLSHAFAAHHNQYDPISGGQSVSNFSLNDIELANKKLYACNTASTTAALDYGNWKMTGQMRKPEVLTSNYSNYNANSTEKNKSDVNAASSDAINYNMNMQLQQSYNNTIKMLRIRRIAQELQQNLPAELRIPNPRSLLKSSHMNTASSIDETDVTTKNIDSLAKSQKTDKLVQNHSLVSSLPYKTQYNHSSLPLETLRNLPNIPHMLERYTNDERYLQSFASSGSSLYHEKTFQMSQMVNKSLPSDVHPVTSAAGVYSQSSAKSVSKDNSIYKAASANSSQVDTKSRVKRKRTAEPKQSPIVGSQSYLTPSSDVLSSVKTNIVPGSAFNFGATANMALGSGLYGDNGGFTIEDIRNNTNQLMAANYMAAAVAHQQRSNEANAEKTAKPAHQGSSHSTGGFPFIGHGQVRGGYGFVGEASSPLYQQYLQRHQEELLRQTGAQIMGLYPPTYPSTLGVRQPYDTINRPSWL